MSQAHPLPQESRQEPLTFFDGATIIGTSSLANGLALFSISTLSPGSHTITVSYSGDADFSPSTSFPYVQVVEEGIIIPTIDLTSSLNPAQFGFPVTFSAEVSSPQDLPTGTVTFFDGSVALGTALLNNGLAQLTVSNLAIGSHSIIAVYNGDSRFGPSFSFPLLEIITTSTIPQSPQTFYGCQILNKFVNYSEIANVLTWVPPQDNEDVVAFEIYRNPELTKLAGRVSNQCPFRYEDGNRKKNKVYTYYIVCVSSAGIKSPAIKTTVRPLKGYKK